MFSIESQPNYGGRVVRCYTDGQTTRFPLSKPIDVPNMMQSIAARAVTLKGAIQAVFEVTI